MNTDPGPIGYADYLIEILQIILPIGYSMQLFVLLLRPNL